MRSMLTVTFTVMMAIAGATDPAGTSAQSGDVLACDGFYYQEDALLVYEKARDERAQALAPNGDGVSCPQLKSLRDDGLWRDEPPVGAEEGVVTDVVDGGIVNVEFGPDGEAATIRPVVIDTPEPASDGNPADCFGPESSAFAEGLLQKGDTVWFTPDVRDSDDNDRLLRHIWFTDEDGTIRLFEREITRNGYAFANDDGEDSLYLPYVSEGMRVAHMGGLGLWGACEDVPEPSSLVDDLTALRDGEAKPLPLDGQQASNEGGTDSATGNCDPAYPTVCIPPVPPDLDCGDIEYDNFEVLPPDPHGFDSEGDGYGCES